MIDMLLGICMLAIVLFADLALYTMGGFLIWTWWKEEGPLPMAFFGVFVLLISFAITLIIIKAI